MESSAAVADKVEAEIKKIENMGWLDFPPNDFGLRIAKRLSDEEISFPHESYDPSKGNQELSGIWAKWRVRYILNELKKEKIDLTWEIGSGDGSVAISLQKEFVAVIGVEPLFNGAAITNENGVRTYLGTLESLNLPSGSISAIGAFDVLEHLPEPRILLDEIYRVLKPGGLLLVTVPAHQWLFSDFDASIGHFRRYSKKTLNSLLHNAGFGEISTSFLFSVFVIPAILLRKLPSLFGRKNNSKETLTSYKKQTKIMKFFEPVILGILYIEDLIRLPFGLSLFGATKK
jgi:SAM-dependent methyltransferase